MPLRLNVYAAMIHEQPRKSTEPEKAEACPTMPIEGFDPPPYINSLISAINDGAKAAQAGAFAFSALGLYLVGVAISTTDEDLLLKHATTVSQIGIQIPALLAFAVAPIIFLALHTFTLIRYDLLASNVKQLESELYDTVGANSDRNRCFQLLANIEFIQSLSPESSGLYSQIFRIVTLILLAAFPVAVLLVVQISFLRYQDVAITEIQRLAVVGDLLLLTWFFRRQRSRQFYGFPGGSVFVIGLILADFCWIGVAGPDTYTIPLQQNSDPADLRAVTGSDRKKSPNEGQENAVLPNGDCNPSKSAGDSKTTFLDQSVAQFARAIAIQPLDLIACQDLGWGCRYLKVDYRSLVDHVWVNQALVDLRARQVDPSDSIAAVEGVFLRSRSLRYSIFTESSLFGANLVQADLTRSNLIRASLDGARLSGAILQGANATCAHLEGAELGLSRLEGATLYGTDLDGASLPGARLDGVDLSFVDLKGADLTGAYLTGANLQSAHLEGAMLVGAHLEGASLIGTHLDGATLRSAYVCNTKTSQDTEFGLTDLRGLNSTDKPADAYVEKLLTQLKSFPERYTQVVAGIGHGQCNSAPLQGSTTKGPPLLDTPNYPAGLLSLLKSGTLDEELYSANLVPFLTKTVINQRSIIASRLADVITRRIPTRVSTASDHKIACALIKLDKIKISMSSSRMEVLRDLSSDCNLISPPVAPTKTAVLTCRIPANGIERYAREFDITRDSGWRGGGYDPTRWCNDVTTQVALENPSAAIHVISSHEENRSSCAPFNCTQYRYTCTVRVQADPIFLLKESPQCAK